MTASKMQIIGNRKLILGLLLLSVVVLTLVRSYPARAIGEAGPTLPSDNSAPGSPPATRLGVAGTGTQFNSPDSYSRLYVPVGQEASARVQVHKKGSSGSLKYIRVYNSTYNSKVDTFSVQDGTSIGVPSGTTGTVSGVVGGVYKSYSVYIVGVGTSSSTDIPFWLTTNVGFLGNDRSTLGGTGYIHDDNPSSGGGNWNKILRFASECTQQGVVNDKITFYDLDIGKSWANGRQGDITLTLNKYDRNTDTLVGTVPITGEIKNGVIVKEGENENFTVYADFESRYEYELILSGINDVNAIRVGIPYDQIGTIFQCPVAPTCSFNGMPSSMATGSSADVDVTITNTNEAPLTFDPSDTKSSLGLIDPSNAHAAGGQYAAPGTNINTNATPDNTTRWRPLIARSGTNLSSFTDTLDGRSKQRIHPSSTVTLQKGQSYTFKITIRASDLAAGNLPASGTGYAIGFRVLQRQYRPAWDSWMPYDAASCSRSIKIVAASPAITANCNLGTSLIEVGESYYPTISFTNSRNDSETATVQTSMALASDVITGSFSTVNKSVPGGLALPPSSSSAAYVTGASSVPPSANNKLFVADGAVQLTAPGSYTATYTWSYATPSGVSGPSAAETDAAKKSPCVQTVQVVLKPYFKVVGGDIISGSTVSGWNKIGQSYGDVSKRDSTGKSGAGAQGLIVSTSVVSGVASGYMFPSFNLPKDRTIANDVGSPDGDVTFGGGYGVFNLPSLSANATNPWGGGTVSGAYVQAGDATYSNTGVAPGVAMTVFVTSGNLTIDNDIKYPANYATRASIPRIKFVVMNGDIRIQPNVRQIDAELITLNGTIDTCYTAQANKYDSCSSAKGSSMLLVNGSLQAPTISLNRLVGTLREGTSTDAARSGPGAYANSGNIGEIVQFTPELFFSQPAEPSMTPLGNRYDAITALPPLF